MTKDCKLRQLEIVFNYLKCNIKQGRRKSLWNGDFVVVIGQMAIWFLSTYPATLRLRIQLDWTPAKSNFITQTTTSLVQGKCLIRCKSNSSLDNCLTLLCKVNSFNNSLNYKFFKKQTQELSQAILWGLNQLKYALNSALPYSSQTIPPVV